jgi:hypothetical protein
MKQLLVAAQQLQEFLEKKRWRFCFIGGIAVQRWGENRVTRDLDLTVLTYFQNDTDYIEQLLTFLKPRRPDAKEFALMSRVLLAETQDGTPVDISLGGLPFEEDMIAQGSLFTFLDQVQLYTCSAESLVVMKAFASRARDWEDIRGILIRQGEKLDRPSVVEKLTPLVELKEEPEILTKLDQLFSEIQGS